MAPTLLEIVEAKYDYSVACGNCRFTRPLDAYALASARGGWVRVDTLRFRCRRCGRLGETKVTEPGNLMMGFPRVWP